MNISRLLKIAPVTLLLIASFVLMSAYQWFAGVQIDAPSTRDLLRFGADFLPLSMIDEPWRLISSGFVHIGVLHLLFNGFALYYFGQVVELVTGSKLFLLIFLLSVAGGNLLGNYTAWQGVLSGVMPSVSAGASGGIMGLGAFLLMLAALKTPIGIQLNTRSLAMIMAINLLMGFAIDGIDNAGHIGGAVTGMVLGLCYAYLRPRRTDAHMIWVLALFSIGFGLVWYWLHSRVLLLI